jgi:transcriptional regulator with XRE-family HTH domain
MAMMFGTDELKQLRIRLGLTQLEIAREMGLAVRSYQELESGEKELRRRHIQLLERVSLSYAVARRDPYLALPSIREEAMEIAGLFSRNQFNSEIETVNQRAIENVSEELAAYQRMLGEKTSGREFANRIQATLIAIRNAVGNLDHRLSNVEQSIKKNM